MIDVFNKKITLRVGSEYVIFNVDQSIKRPPGEDDECYGIDDLDTTIHLKTQELLEDDQLDLFLINNLEGCDDQSDLESCGKVVGDSKSETSIRRIERVNTPYSESRETQGPERTQKEHLYSASANEIDKKKTRTERPTLPFRIRVLEKRKGAITWKMSDIKGISPSFWFFQIPIAPEDQAKTTFTCPYGTFAYRRMPFGLCNAPATFQRCMTAIFHDMVEDFMEVFMDDFLVFSNSFDQCLDNLDKMLARCEETNLVLN
ncbi:reverse transcriptase domain-containing protein [Tanacetum coccineum]